jgi:hypothetical protein
MISILILSVVDRELETWLGQTKHNNIGICCFSASTQLAKTCWLEIRIMCTSGVTCSPADCCFSELAL